MPKQMVMINRAPVLTLWAYVVAERLGYEHDTALTLGKAVAGLNAQSKDRMLGIFGPRKGVEPGRLPKKAGLGKEFWINLCQRGGPAKNTDKGIRAVLKDRPIVPDKVEFYLKGKFGDDLEAAISAMQDLAQSMMPDELAECSYPLYEKFRPEVPPGQQGWGAKGKLNLDLIRSLVEED